MTGKPQIAQNPEEISKVLESGNTEEKIRVLETLDSAANPEIVEKIISRLDDEDIRVRGEAFSTLILNKNGISDFLVDSLGSASKNIRGFASLVLANRNDTSAIPEIIKLAGDERSMVRSCALGALGYLKAREAGNVFLESLTDASLDVRKSALQAVIELNIAIPEDKIKEIGKEKDPEMERLLSQLKNL